jgi:formylglycine-generating enzyme required for sulfatase activity
METRRNVAAETSRQQIPWESSSLMQDVYLLAGGAPEDRDLQPIQPQSTGIFKSTSQDSPLTLEPATPFEKAPELTSEKQMDQPALSPMSEAQSGKALPVSPSAGQVWTEPTTGMEFVWVPGGCYMMGSPLTGKTAQIQKNSKKPPLWYQALAAISSLLPYGCVTGSTGSSTHMSRSYFDIHGYDKDETPVHEVCLDGFWMGRYEVTQEQWLKMMERNPSHFQSGNNLPVDRVSWHEAKQFISLLNERSGHRFSLPTEAQWEYAARSGGRAETYAGSDNVNHVAWYFDNSGNKTHSVGAKAPNGLGIYDMSGNVWEWCEDVYHKNGYSRHTRRNPLVTSGGTANVHRGGSWDCSPNYVRVTYRSRLTPVSRSFNLGFRLSLSETDQ